MIFQELLRLVRPLPWFELQMLTQAFPLDRKGVLVQLSRWIRQGKIISLRRGMYVLGTLYRSVQVTGPGLANHLLAPSYLSDLWALSWYDLIPERVSRIISVTPRATRRFVNPFGEFQYRHLKQCLFRGFRGEFLGSQRVQVAEPEKALLDHWHLSCGEWTDERIIEMRYQNTHQVDRRRLAELGEQFASPRIDRAIHRWVRLYERDDDAPGTVTI